MFWLGVITALVVSGCTMLITTVSSKKFKCQEANSQRSYYTGGLFFRTSKKDPLIFNYKGHDVSIWVERRRGDWINCDVVQDIISINDKECARTIRISDGCEYYYSSCVYENYIEDEVWDILKEAYRFKVFATNTTEETTNKKESILNK